MSRRRVVIAYGLILAVALAAVLVPYALRDRAGVAGTGSAPPRAPEMATTFALEPGREACVHEVVLDERTAEIRFPVEGGAGASLRVTARAAGYRAQAPARLDGDVAVARLAPPAGEVLGDVCVENAGPQAVALGGTRPEWEAARPTASLDGTPVAGDLTVLLGRGEPVSLAGEATTIAERIERLTSVPAWLVLCLFAAALVLLAVGPVRALAAAASADERLRPPGR